MAFSTAVCAALASATVASFFALASVRVSVASAMAASSSATALARSVRSWVRSAIVEVRSSFSAVSAAMASVFWSRVCLLVVSSVSQKPLCSVSSVPSVMSFEIMSLIIFLTFTKGSEATRWEIISRDLLLYIWARSARKAAMRACIGLCSLLLTLPLRSCTSAAPFLSCTRAGRCLSPAPETESLDMISMAFWIASSSSARSFWRDAKSACLVWHRAVMSPRYFWSSARSAVVCARLPSASALPSCVAALVDSFLEISCLAFSTLSVSCWRMPWYACSAVISSLSRSYFWVLNWSFSFSSMSTTPPDWKP
mmetsp:Transcript_86818/g.187834  ORF Transcript_86818/g.187834 Transcript_86818/m.187834 type:complete len:311 (-) Transcript_86818:660-1592(-)